MIPVQITFRNLDASPAAEVLIRKHIAELEQFSERLAGCRVVVFAGNRHQGRLGTCRVHLELSVPGGPIIVNGEHGSDHTHEDLNLAIRNTFDAARRRLQDHFRRMNGNNRPHGNEPESAAAG